MFPARFRLAEILVLAAVPFCTRICARLQYAGIISPVSVCLRRQARLRHAWTQHNARRVPRAGSPRDRRSGAAPRSVHAGQGQPPARAAVPVAARRLGSLPDNTSKRDIEKALLLN